MENYIVIEKEDGNTIRLELTPDQVATLEREGVWEKVGPYARRIVERYWYITSLGTASSDVDDGDALDNARYVTGNYYPDEESAQQQAWREILDRLLRRYSEQHGGDPEWDRGNTHWYIWFDYDDGAWATSYTYTAKYSHPYFCSREVAEAAIKEVVEPFCKAHPEFVW